MSVQDRYYLLRIEGVNLAHVIDDTDQLSIRRGGGLMLLNAVQNLQESLDPKIADRLTPVATGASIGLFTFQAADGKDAEAVRDAVEKHLTGETLPYKDTNGNDQSLPLKHATFVVDVVATDEYDSIQQAEQQATAMNRWQQLRRPSMSLDGLWDNSNNFCTFNRIRTAQTRARLPEIKTGPACHSANDRREYGRGARQQFYQKELGRQTELNVTFTDDLQALSSAVAKSETNIDENWTIKPVPPNLASKIAIFYVDGNGFGKLGRDAFSEGGTDRYREWSSALKAHHRRLLKSLLGLVEDDPFWNTENDEVRLETLLWGGDEILWVVPAWKGWEVARWFFEQEHEVELDGKTIELTYGCGLVFCHAKAPIKNTSALAHRLGDLAKGTRKGENVHRLAYEVLESYDDISGDLSDHRKRFLPAAESVDRLVFDPGLLASHWDALTAIAASSEFPMRQLYRYCAAWRNGNADEMQNAEKRLQKALNDAGIDASDCLTDLGSETAWLHLLQMLPYLPITHLSSNQFNKVPGGAP